MKRNVILLSIFVVPALLFIFAGCPDPDYDSTYPLRYDANGGTGTVPAQYTVTYHINNGTGTVPESQSVDGGSSVTLADGNDLSRSGYFFGGWNTNSSGTGTAYDACSPFTPTGNSANITLYAMWIAPRIRTEDAYKEVTSNGRVRVHLMTDARYIFSGTEEYRLYRSETRNGTYSVVATASPDQLVLVDTTADWLTTGGSYFYKVAAVSDGIEAMSRNGVSINKGNWKVSMQYTSYAYGYCAVVLAYDINDSDTWYIWQGATNSIIRAYDLKMTATGLPPPPGECILLTGTSNDISTWVIRGPLTIRAGHTYMITVYPYGSVNDSFDKSNWTFFTP